MVLKQKKKKSTNIFYIIHSSERVKCLALTLDYMEGQAQELTNHKKKNIKTLSLLFLSKAQITCQLWFCHVWITKNKNEQNRIKQVMGCCVSE